MEARRQQAMQKKAEEEKTREEKRSKEEEERRKRDKEKENLTDKKQLRQPAKTVCDLAVLDHTHSISDITLQLTQMEGEATKKRKEAG